MVYDASSSDYRIRNPVYGFCRIEGSNPSPSASDFFQHVNISILETPACKWSFWLKIDLIKD
jgi:hypothetical protein